MTTKMIGFLCLFGALLSMASCQSNNDDDDPVQAHDDAMADVFIKKIPDSVLTSRYALVFYAYGSDMAACEAEAPDGTRYTLKPYWKSGSMRYLPQASDYTSHFPDTGTYRFHFAFHDQQTKVLDDHLYNLELDAITSATISHSPGYHGTSISWSLVQQVDEYVVRLTSYPPDQQADLFGQGALTVADNGIYFDSLYQATPGWNTQLWPAYGDSCYIMVEAWKNEPGSTAPKYNRQMLTERGQMIIW